MRVTFWGAARTVTGSKHLLTGRSGAMLLDCGLFQGRRAESEARNRSLPFDAASVDCMVLSHAHIDHSGAIPFLCKQGFRGPIHATAATVDLCRAMLLDAAHIQVKDAEFVNRHHRGKSQAPVLPLYTPEDAERSLERFVPHRYEEPFEPLERTSVRFHEAGHIPGSASMEIHWKENGSQGSLVFSGDLGRPDRPILKDPAPLPKADYLITEGTYGGKQHPDEITLHETLERVVRQAIERGGRIVIPAFAVGRTQEVVHALDRLFVEGRIPALPIYVDSPLAAEILIAVGRHPEVFDEETTDAIQKGQDPLGMRRITLVRDAEDSKKLNEKPGTFITIAASGMCEAGRILHHLKHTVSDPRHTIVIVGYQADGTLGRRLVEHQPEVRIFGEPFPLHATVEVLNGFSAHADHPALVAQVKSCGAAKGCAVVHADPERAEALRAAIAPLTPTRIPSEGDVWELR
ncbi:MAG TPA: MBL fold metallo-hydrolase [Candidatus Dormibacteraeota bacterium]|nr:MBL fold metallo-hydrolase [Candidatus Dormibacteraeota bacterium]